MKRIKGWLMTPEVCERFFELSIQFANNVGRDMTQEEKEKLLDVLAKKMPYEHLEAFMHGKRALYYKGEQNGQ